MYVRASEYQFARTNETVVFSSYYNFTVDAAINYHSSRKPGRASVTATTGRLEHPCPSLYDHAICLNTRYRT